MEKINVSPKKSSLPITQSSFIENFKLLNEEIIEMSNSPLNSWNSQDFESSDIRPHLIFSHNVGISLNSNVQEIWRPILFECFQRSFSFVCTEIEESTILITKNELLPGILDKVTNPYKISLDEVKYKLNGFRSPIQRPGRVAPSFSNGFMLMIHSV